MAELTIQSGESLPRICMFTGSDDAPVQRLETIVCTPNWVYSVLWVPMGWVAVMFLTQLHQKEYRITYYLSNAGWSVIRKRRMVLVALFILVAVCWGLGALYKSLILMCLPFVVLFPFGFWFEKKHKYPFLVKSYNSLTVTLTGVPENLVTAHEAAIASRRPGVPRKPDMGKPARPTV